MILQRLLGTLPLSELPVQNLRTRWAGAPWVTPPVARAPWVHSKRACCLHVPHTAQSSDVPHTTLFPHWPIT